jgi:hypothetical protein
MPHFSAAFRIGKTQPELDFVDVSLQTDNPLFLDPFAISQRSDRWSQEAHHTIVTFFQEVVDDIRSGHEERARTLLANLREPNETRLGYSAHRPKGAGIGTLQAEELFEALRDSAAVRTGFIGSLEESELMIDGISYDKISDLTTNVIRSQLVNYTIEQCELLGISRRDVALPACFNSDTMEWETRYSQLPVYRNTPIVLVPKSIVRRSPAYDYRRYYQHFVLNYLQQEELENPASRLVRTLKNKRRVVYKKDVAAKYPRAKTFLYEFSREHPEVLKRYRKWLGKEEQTKTTSDVDEEDERLIAGALAETLRGISPGSNDATEYHQLMIGVVEFLFFPTLLHPKKEHEIHQGRKRIDILMENGATAGIFHVIPVIRKLPCAYVPFECKNYTTEVANPELDQLAGRFSVNRGKLGFLCCRNFQDRARFVESCRDTFKDDRGLIMPLDDQTVLRMLAVIEKGNRTEIEPIVSGLVSEIWAA